MLRILNKFENFRFHNNLIDKNRNTLAQIDSICLGFFVYLKPPNFLRKSLF